MAVETRSDNMVLRIFAVVIVVLGLVGFAGYRYLEQQDKAAAAANVLTPEAKTYTRNLQLSDVQMIANVNWMQQRVIEITGQIKNAGDRPVTGVAISCIFYDTTQTVVHRERVYIVKPGTTPLAPGGTRTFRLPFDTVPAGWNQTLPQMVIAQILF